MTSQQPNTLPDSMRAKPTKAQPPLALTMEEQKALERYEKTHHLSALPHEDAGEGIERSTGEKTFNIVTYKGIGWLTNAAISVYITDLFMHGVGKKYFDAAIEKLAPKFQKMMGATKELSHQRARASMMTLGLFSGGTLLLYPIKKLEDHKESIVKWLDAKINQYRTPTEEQLVTQKQAHERLENDPNPSWPNVILGRILGTAAVCVVTIGIMRTRDEKAAKYVTKKVGEAMQESASPNIRKLGSSERIQNMSAIAMLEIYTSLIAEEVLYYTTRAYRSLWHKKQAEIAAANGNGATNADPHDSTEQHVAAPVEKPVHKVHLPTTTVADHVIASAYQPQAVGMEA